MISPSASNGTLMNERSPDARRVAITPVASSRLTMLRTMPAWKIFRAPNFDRDDGPLAHLGGNFVVQGDDLPGLSHRVEQGDAHPPAGDQALYVTDRRLGDLMR